MEKERNGIYLKDIMGNYQLYNNKKINLKNFWIHFSILSIDIIIEEIKKMLSRVKIQNLKFMKVPL